MLCISFVMSVSVWLLTTPLYYHIYLTSIHLSALEFQKCFNRILTCMLFEWHLWIVNKYKLCVLCVSQLQWCVLVTVTIFFNDLRGEQGRNMSCPKVQIKNSKIKLPISTSFCQFTLGFILKHMWTGSVCLHVWYLCSERCTADTCVAVKEAFIRQQLLTTLNCKFTCMWSCIINNGL